MPGCTNTLDNTPKNKPSASMTHAADVSMLRSVVRLGICGRIHAQETGWQPGMPSCIMPGLSTHLVQELNAGTVHHKDIFVRHVI